MHSYDRFNRGNALVAFSLALLCLIPCRSGAEPGVSERTITIGMSAPLTGIHASIGSALKRGVEAGFEQVNASGELGARRVVLRVLDDAGESERALKNTRALLDEGAFALTGYHGAAAVEAVMGLLDESGVPMVGAASGAESLREPPRKALFNLRASVRDEAAAIIYQLDAIGATRMATIAQNDALGIAVLAGMQAELVRVGMRAVSVERIAPMAGDDAWNTAVRNMCKEQPEAVLLALDPRNALLAIQHARKQKCRPQFYVTSETGAVLAELISRSPEVADVISAQILPPPGYRNHPLAMEYQKTIGGNDAAQASYSGLEGYLYARVLGRALQLCIRDLTRKCLVATLESQSMDVLGYRLDFGPNSRRGSRFVELTMIDARGRFRR